MNAKGGVTEINIAVGGLFKNFKIGGFGGVFNFSGVGNLNFVMVFSNGAIGGGKFSIDFIGILLSFLTKEGAIFGEEKIPREKGIPSHLVRF